MGNEEAAGGGTAGTAGTAPTLMLQGCQLLFCDGDVATWSNGETWRRAAPVLHALSASSSSEFSSGDTYGTDDTSSAEETEEECHPADLPESSLLQKPQKHSPVTASC